MQTQIECFKPGRHTAQNGRVYEFSEADVAGIAAAYDRNVAAAPAVLGHPKTDDPAWAWSEGFAVEGGKLVVNLVDIDPAFAEGVTAGRYRYTSLALYEPSDSRNPKPGSWYPRHVGFLGAQPPAIKGLAPAFAEAAADAAVVEFSMGEEVGWSLRQVGSALRGIRDWMIGKFGQEEADKALPAWNDQALADTAASVIDAARDSSPAYAEALATPTAALALLAAELDAREAALAKREQGVGAKETEFAEAAFATGRTADATFVDGLVAEGKLPPGHKDDVLASLAHARGDAGGPAFAEGCDAHGSLRRLLEGLGVSIVFAEIATAPGLQFAERQDPAAHAEAIRAVMAEAESQGRSISAAEAARIARTR